MQYEQTDPLFFSVPAKTFQVCLPNTAVELIELCESRRIDWRNPSYRQDFNWWFIIKNDGKKEWHNSPFTGNYYYWLENIREYGDDYQPVFSLQELCSLALKVGIEIERVIFLPCNQFFEAIDSRTELVGQANQPFWFAEALAQLIILKLKN